jgi:flagellar FliL protein
MESTCRTTRKGRRGQAQKGKKGLIIIIAAVPLLAGGGGGRVLLHEPKPEASADAEGSQPAAREKEQDLRTLDPFTVNLADEGGERFIQVAVVLEVADAKVSGDLTAQMPAVRNAVLMLLSSKLAKELLTVPGKERLAEEIATATGVQLGWEPPEEDEEEKPRKTKVKAAAGAWRAKK